MECFVSAIPFCLFFFLSPCSHLLFFNQWETYNRNCRNYQKQYLAKMSFYGCKHKAKIEYMIATHKEMITQNHMQSISKFISMKNKNIKFRIIYSFFPTYSFFSYAIWLISSSNCFFNPIQNEMLLKFKFNHNPPSLSASSHARVPLYLYMLRHPSFLSDKQSKNKFSVKKLFYT